MSGFDDIKNKAEGLAGKAKEAFGNATDNESVKDEGKADQVKSDAKGKAEELKDKATDAANKTIGGLKD